MLMKQLIFILLVSGVDETPAPGQTNEAGMCIPNFFVDISPR